MKLKILSTIYCGLLMSITLSGSMMAMDSDEDSADKSQALPTSVQSEHSSDEEESNESGSAEESEGPALTFQNPQSQWLMDAHHEAVTNHMHLDHYIFLQRSKQTYKINRCVYVMPSFKLINNLKQYYLSYLKNQARTIEEALSQQYHTTLKSIDRVHKTGQQMIQKLNQFVSERLKMEDDIKYRIIQEKQELREGEQELLSLCREHNPQKWFELKVDEAKAKQHQAKEKNKQLVAQSIARTKKIQADVEREWREKKMAQLKAELERNEKQIVQDKIASDRLSQKFKSMLEEAETRVAEEERKSKELDALRIARDQEAMNDMTIERFGNTIAELI